VSLPNANITVNEKRSEGFANVSWTVLPGLSLEGGTRLEYSQISATGDSSRTRDFLYVKPRLLLAWSPDSKTQLRLRVERKLGQLDFSNFVASSNLSTFGVAAGNADLRPDQRWQFEADAERHFGDKGALVLSLLHEQITTCRIISRWAAGWMRRATSPAPPATRSASAAPFRWISSASGMDC
jgi:outer membrane receptor protein involved in Fe transport